MPSHGCNIATGSTKKKIDDGEALSFVLVSPRIFLIRRMLQIIVPVIIVATSLIVRGDVVWSTFRSIVQDFSTSPFFVLYYYIFLLFVRLFVRCYCFVVVVVGFILLFCFIYYIFVFFLFLTHWRVYACGLVYGGFMRVRVREGGRPRKKRSFVLLSAVLSAKIICE